MAKQTITTKCPNCGSNSFKHNWVKNRLQIPDRDMNEYIRLLIDDKKDEFIYRFGGNTISIPALNGRIEDWKQLVITCSGCGFTHVEEMIPHIIAEAI